MGNVLGPGHGFDPARLAADFAEPVRNAAEHLAEAAPAPVSRAPTSSGRPAIGRPLASAAAPAATSATERVPYTGGGGWDVGWIFQNLRQSDQNPDTHFDSMRCVAASTLSGFMARGPQATARALESVVAFERHPALVDPYNQIRAAAHGDDLKRLTDSECATLSGVAARVRGGTATLADLEMAQDLAYKAANVTGDDMWKSTPRAGDQSGLQFPDFLLLQQMLGNEHVLLAPAQIAFEMAPTKPLRAFADALRPGEHGALQLHHPDHVVGIGRDPKGRVYAYDSARRAAPYGVFRDHDPAEFEKLLAEFEPRRQKGVPPDVLRQR